MLAEVWLEEGSDECVRLAARQLGDSMPLVLANVGVALQARALRQVAVGRFQRNCLVHFQQALIVMGLGRNCRRPGRSLRTRAPCLPC